MTNKDYIFKSSVKEFIESVNISNPTNEEDAYKMAVELAYKDLQWRTIKNHDNKYKSDNIKSIAKLFMENVKHKKNHIDLINEVCKLFCKDFGDFAREQCFGKAQKVVNMGFKYLYCINSCYNLVDIDYKDRDIPLDNRILYFYYLHSKSKKISTDKKVTWSNINKEEYSEIQTKLKQYLKEDIDLDMLPIEAEFIIWNYATAKLKIDGYNKIIEEYRKFKKDKVATNDCYDFIKNKLNTK